MDLRADMGIYLGNPVTEKILFKPIRSNIVTMLEQARTLHDRLLVGTASDETALHAIDKLEESLTMSLE